MSTAWIFVLSVLGLAAVVVWAYYAALMWGLFKADKEWRKQR